MRRVLKTDPHVPFMCFPHPSLLISVRQSTMAEAEAGAQQAAGAQVQQEFDEDGLPKSPSGGCNFEGFNAPLAQADLHPANQNGQPVGNQAGQQGIQPSPELDAFHEKALRR
jgi:hypothetical protein